MLITLWENLGSQIGIRLETPWGGLGAAIAALPPTSLFSCAAFRGDERGEKHFIAATAIVLDHDTASMPLEFAATRLKASGALLYETKTPGRWRAILPLAEPIEGYDDYTALVQPIRQAFDCARESATGAQMWWGPRKGFRYLSPFDGEHRLLAWITGDYDNALVEGDLPRRAHDGNVDRSSLDMRIVLRLIEIGVTQSDAYAIMRSRGELSHSGSEYHLDLLWKKANAFRDARKEDSLWGAPEVEETPRVRVRIGADIHRVADDVIAALVHDDRLFTRDASIVELITHSENAAITRALSQASVQDRISKTAFLYQVSKDKEGNVSEAPVMPPKDLAAIVRDRGSYPPLRFLRGITEVPILRPDGSIAESDGYDPHTKFYRAGKIAPDLTPHSPDRALAILREPFLEFPWAKDSMVDIAVALVCSVICRSAIDGNVPLFVFDAAKQASGKSLLVETLSAIINGHASGAGTFPSDDAELQKTLSGFARASRGLISFDNCTRAIKGEALDSALTCGGKVTFRILGQSKIQTCDWYSVISINGNQIRIEGDTRRRAVVARLTPALGKRVFRHELPQYAYANRAQLLGAAITLIRAGLLAGPAKIDNRPSFETYVKTIASAIVHAGGHDITEFWNEEHTATESDDAREVLTVWLLLRWPNGATATAIADDLGDSFMPSASSQALINANKLDKPLREALRFISEAYPKATKRQAMAYALHSWRDIQMVGGLRITGNSGRNALWQTTS